MSDPIPNLTERLSRHAKQFTQRDRLIADYLLRSYPACLFQNASDIAEKLEINVSTVTRFFPKIGYGNLKEAWADLRRDLQFLVDSPLTRFQSSCTDESETTQALIQAMETDWTNIQKSLSSVDAENIERFLDLIADQSRGFYFLGTGKEYSLAYYFLYQLVGLRNNALLIDPSNVVNHLANLQSCDVLVIFDFRRYAALHSMAAEYAKEIGACLVVFSDSTISPSARIADCLFLIHSEGISAFDSYTAGMTLINALLGMIVARNRNPFEAKYNRLEHLKHRMKIFSFNEECVFLDLKEKKADSLLRGTHGDSWNSHSGTDTKA
ncbi:MAG: hypothetical protein CSB23_04715 [Deltaproteobacteria bacterium]|nr:MAG: hypothetical protein CSB23_04715 [Deltaproteobacteria bacterium]